MEQENQCEIDKNEAPSASTKSGKRQRKAKQAKQAKKSKKDDPTYEPDDSIRSDTDESEMEKPEPEKRKAKNSNMSVEYENFKVGFGKKNDVVMTPDELYQILNDEFKFDFDPAPLWENGVQKWDGLEVEWGQSNYINPPYSNIGKWFKKAVEEMRKGKTSVFLVPMRMTPKYWREWAYPYASELRVLADRIMFKGYEDKGKAPFPVGILVYRPYGSDEPLREGVDFDHKLYPMKKFYLDPPNRCSRCSSHN